MDDWGLNWWFEATGRLLNPQNWMCELPDPFFWGGVLFHGWGIPCMQMGSGRCAFCSMYFTFVATPTWPNFDTYQECQSFLFFFHKDHEKFECANFRICHIEFQHSSTIFLWMSIFLFPGVLADHWRARRLRLAKPGACAVRWLSVPNMRPGKSGIWLDSDGTNSYTYYMKYYCIWR